LLHVSAAEPARGSEYLGLLLRNTNTGIRSVFWSGKTLMFLFQYGKGHDRVIAKFIPPSLCELFLIYLFYIRPMQAFIASLSNNHQGSKLLLDQWAVFNSKMMVEKKFSSLISRYFNDHAGIDISISDYRHIAVQLGRCCNQNINFIPQMTLTALDETAGHTSFTASKRYARSKNTPLQLDHNRMQEFVLAANAWHKLLGFSELFTANKVEYNKEDLSTIKTTPVISTVPNANVDISQIAKVVQDCLATFHVPTVSSMQRPMPPIDPIHSHHALKGLRLLGHNSWLSQEQGLACALAVENDIDFAVVMGTGQGKSNIFFIPAILKDGTRIVISPLISLNSEHFQQAQKQGLSVQHYDNIHTIDLFDPPNIIIVQLEHAITRSFFEFASTLNHLGCLRAIIFDEADEFIRMESYRDVGTSLVPLMSIPVQIIALTATGEPSILLQLEKLLGCSLALIKTSTVRSNISINIHDNVVDIDKEICNLLKQFSLEHATASNRRAIVFCHSKESVEKLILQVRNNDICAVFVHADNEKHINDQNLKIWTEGLFPILISTQYVGRGLNNLGVDLVIHRIGCSSLADLHQQQGRAGRCGQLSNHIVVTNKPGRAVLARISAGFQSVNKWIENSNNCRRYTLHAAIDDIPTQCAMIPDAELCDNCKKLSTSISQLKPRKTNHISAMARANLVDANLQKARRIVHAINELDNIVLGKHCLICIISSRCKAEHTTMQCPVVRMQNRCCYCLGKHFRKDCRNMMECNNSCSHCHHRWNAPQLHNCILHHGPYGNQCPRKLVGERIRVAIWAFYRFQFVKLKSMFPELELLFRKILSNNQKLLDSTFCQWLTQTSDNNITNNYMVCAATLIDFVA
jgi:hypothetical protein